MVMQAERAIPKHLVEAETITWAGDSSPFAKIQTTGMVTRITLEVELVPSATLTGANQPDGLNRLVQNFSVKGNGVEYFGLPGDDGCQGGTIIRYLNYIDGMGIGHGNGAIAAPARTFTGVRFAFHCGARPRDPYFGDNEFDMTGMIPAGMLSTLQATWSTSGNDVLDDTVTVSSAVGRLGVSRVNGDIAGVMAFAQRQGAGQAIMRSGNDYVIKVPSWIPQVVAHSGTTTSFETRPDDLTTGAYLKRLSILGQDATATRTLRAGDVLSDIQVAEANSKAPLLEYTAEMLQAKLPKAFNVEADDAAEDFQGGAPQGLYVIDFRPMMNQVYGLNMHSEKVRNSKYQVRYKIPTYASGDDRLLLEERIADMTLSARQMEDAVSG